MKAEPRRAVPMRVQRDVALALCVTLLKRLDLLPADAAVTWELDHAPALCLRAVDPATGAHIPHQHDPDGLVWLTKEAHAAKTRGTGATTRGSDIGEAAHNRRLGKLQAEFRAALLRKGAGEPRPPSRWPSRSFQSRNDLRKAR